MLPVEELAQCVDNTYLETFGTPVGVGNTAGKPSLRVGKLREQKTWRVGLGNGTRGR